MTFLRGIFLTGVALSLSLPAVAELKQQTLVGTWYSEMQDQGETVKRLVKREADNSYAALLLICEGKEFSWVQKELGTWKVTGDNTFETTMTSLEDMNGKKQADPDAALAQYTDVVIDGDKLSYELTGKDHQATFERVDDGYQIRCE